MEKLIGADKLQKFVDEYADIKLQQECVSKTIDTLWKMAQKYQKIAKIAMHYKENVRDKVTNENMEKILEIIEDEND